jgi:hypothetical protein
LEKDTKDFLDEIQKIDDLANQIHIEAEKLKGIEYGWTGDARLRDQIHRQIQALGNQVINQNDHIQALRALRKVG